MGKTNERKERSHEEIPVYWLAKLAESMKSHRKVGDLLGVSQSTISSAIREGKVRPAYELAAQQIYHEKFAPQGNMQIAIIRHDANSMVFLRSMVEKTGGRMEVLKD